MDDKKLIFSAIQPTGTFTLGNYIGAIRNWAPLQEQFNSIYCVADMHAMLCSWLAESTLRSRYSLYRAMPLHTHCSTGCSAVIPSSVSFHV